MINFKSKIKKVGSQKTYNPIEIYDSLDRVVDKGPLRPAQEYILKEWYENHYEENDVIVKLHTGQGKTLIGLLMILSRLYKKSGPAIYLCPNNYLVSQTCTQAKQFGIPFCDIDNELPPEFLSGNKLLITSIQKLFNGLTKFKLGPQSIDIDTVLIDDAHTCINSIKESCMIRIKREENEAVYNQFMNIFKEDLQGQGAGTFYEIMNKSMEAIQCVPYWAWQEKQEEITKVISSNLNENYVKFAWPLIKNDLPNCYCVFSGQSIEIAPYITPIDQFRSFSKARQKIYMSATFFDDAFLIKDFNVSENTIKNPLIYPNEKWSGEKMIIIPSLINKTLDRSAIVNHIGNYKNTNFGIVILSTSFTNTRDWETIGCKIVHKEDIKEVLMKLRNGEYEKPIIIVNRYDGIDLPDQMCRLLVIDSQPISGTLYEKSQYFCRINSDIIQRKIAQTIEQGMGRAVRGEKDYCAIVIIGSELVSTIQSKKTRALFSAQMQTQIEIGIEITNLAKEDIEANDKPISILNDLLNQLLKRNEDWKDYYVEKMNNYQSQKENNELSTKILSLEKKANDYLITNQINEAIHCFQDIIDKCNLIDEEKGWYLQEIARVNYQFSKSESNKLQLAAHNKNRYLMKPINGMSIKRMDKLSQKRVERIKEWISSNDDYSELQIKIDEILGRLCFSINYRKFENALDQVGKIMGFDTQQPDKEYKEGPDNLWLIDDDKYLLFECKNEVELSRAEINKNETGQMNNSIAWFEREYHSNNVFYFHIIPTRVISRAAGYNKNVEIITECKLKKLKTNIKSFYLEFEKYNLKNLSEEFINSLLSTHHLMIDDFTNRTYSEKAKQL